MKTAATILLATLVLAACKKDQRDVELRVECEKCTVDANGLHADVAGTYSRMMNVDDGATVALSACRALPDTVITGSDTTVIEYRGAIGIWIFSEGELALASDAAFYPDDCAQEVARVE